jgi:hypothetical protein
MTKVLERTTARFLADDRFLFVAGNIESLEVLNWCSASGFSIYAEDDLKPYCLWSVTRIVQHRGNLYADSLVAK